MTRREKKRRNTSPRAQWKRILNARRPYEGMKYGRGRGTYSIADLLLSQTDMDLSFASVARALQADVLAYSRLTARML